MKKVRLIDADALMEHVYRDRLDSRELIAEMVRNAPTIEPGRKLMKRKGRDAYGRLVTQGWHLEVGWAEFAEGNPDLIETVCVHGFDHRGGWFAQRLFCEKPERKEEPAQNVPKEDLISRKSAIKETTSGVILVPNDSIEAVREVIELFTDKIKNLPSAQAEPIRINLNEQIKVKLTHYGKGIYYHQYDRINQIAGTEICKPELPKEDENGYTEFQLWYFMELYGEHMGMTMPNVIEPLEIVYERRTDG